MRQQRSIYRRPSTWATRNHDPQIAEPLPESAKIDIEEIAHEQSKYVFVLYASASGQSRFVLSPNYTTKNASRL